MYRIRRSEDVEAVKALHTLIFPADVWETADAYWIVWDDSNSPVGFCSAMSVPAANAGYLVRAGLFPSVCGQGLQKRMIKIREKWAREQGHTKMITYTVYDNHPSIVTLLKSKYKLFFPQYMWAGRTVHYFIKDL